MASITNMLIQIIPSLPPHVDGIGDHALELARQLRIHHGVETTFLVCDPAWRNDGTLDFAAHVVPARSRHELSRLVRTLRGGSSTQCHPVLLHFSPYGYQKRGFPLWLVDALEDIERCAPGCVNTAFHELEVHSNKLYSSAFWVSPLQRYLIRRLTRMGTFNYTNTELHRFTLEGWGSGRIACLPNFSTMKDVGILPQFNDRTREIVVFGRADQRRWSYQRGGQALAQVCQHIEAIRIVDIGPPIAGHTETHFHGVPIVRLGILPQPKLIAAMQSAFAGFLYYPVPLLTKSSAHALMRSSGTIAFVFDDSKIERSCPGLSMGTDFIMVAPGTPLPDIAVLETLPPQIYRNYETHNSKKAADIINVGLVEQFRYRCSTPASTTKESGPQSAVRTGHALAATLSGDRKACS